MDLPPGTVDPIFLHQLALRLGMTVTELCYGRGTVMSAHELSVAWPAFFAWQEMAEEREREREKHRLGSRGR